MTDISTFKTPTNPVTGKEYSGKNVDRLITGSASNAWATYRQWSSAGYQVKKGQSGTKILAFDRKKKEDKKTKEVKVESFMKTYSVFSAEQVAPIEG